MHECSSVHILPEIHVTNIQQCLSLYFLFAFVFEQKNGILFEFLFCLQGCLDWYLSTQTQAQLFEYTAYSYVILIS